MIAIDGEKHHNSVEDGQNKYYLIWKKYYENISDNNHYKITNSFHYFQVKSKEMSEMKKKLILGKFTAKSVQNDVSKIRNSVLLTSLK